MLVDSFDTLHQKAAEHGLGAGKVFEAGQAVGALVESKVMLTTREMARTIGEIPEMQSRVMKNHTFTYDDVTGSVKVTGEGYDPIIKRVESLRPPTPPGSKQPTALAEFDDLLKYTDARHILKYNRSQGAA